MKILFDGGKPCGVELKTSEKLYASYLIYSGTVWNLYGKLIDPGHSSVQRREWAAKQVPTYPSVVLYAHVYKSVIPEGTAPIEMLIGNPDEIDESEVTVYILSIDDRTLCDEDGQVIVAIGPTFESWDCKDETEYQTKKEREQIRLIGVLEKRFPGFSAGVRYAEVATPRTIERYTNKNGGGRCGGPSRCWGQHMFKRLHTRSEWDNLFCCGGIHSHGGPERLQVTTSGISAANAVLKKAGLKPFVYEPDRKNYVRTVDKPFFSEALYRDHPEEMRAVMIKASACQFCEVPGCSLDTDIDIRGIMRRVMVGNMAGAKKLVERTGQTGRGCPGSMREALHRE